MARTTKKSEKTETTPIVTRAEKKDATKNLIRELLAVKPYKHNELLDAVAKLYTERFGGEDTENVNDVKGRIGSVLDIMKKDSDVMYDGGMYALKARGVIPAPTDTPSVKPKKTRTKKTAKAEAPTPTELPVAEEKPVEDPLEKPAKKTARKTTKKKAEPTAVAEPMAENTVEKAVATPQTEEKPAPKKRGRKPKGAEAAEPAKEPEQAAVKTQAEEKQEEKKGEEPSVKQPEPQEKPIEEKTEQPQQAAQPKAEEKPAETPVERGGALTVKEKGEVAKKDVIDVSFLLGTPKKPTPAPVPKTETVAKPQAEVKKPQGQPAPKAETVAKPQEQPTKRENAPVKKPTERKMTLKTATKTSERALTADEKLRESFLKKLRSLGGDYFEYYSVYLLERYCMKNGRRLEGMRVNGGDHDGGIDGEIELTDKFGFRETIYVQSKNWNPEKGDERLWVVGETLLQQFIGACACRQAREGKQSCRGIFITTSRFTPEAKRVLETMSEKIIGYDGNDVYEAAKECEFGLVKKNGEWSLDEKLLGGTKAFFNML